MKMQQTSMILIVAALKEEIRYFLNTNRFKKDDSQPFGKLYRASAIHILVTGVGMEKANKALSKYLIKHQPLKIINLGVCGSLNPAFQIGEIFQISKVYSEGRHKSYHLKTTPNNPFKKTALISVKEAVLNQKRRELVQNRYKANLVDMELFALVKACEKYELPISAYKIVSDNADEHTSSDFFKGYKKRCANLALQVSTIINDFLE
jgi:nucleoside phosphorylase